MNYRFQPRRSANSQPPGLLPPYILTSLLPYLVFDRHVTKNPSPQPLCFPHFQDCDARNSFRFCSYANCRVSMRSPDLSTFLPPDLATRFDLSPFFSNSCALFCTYERLNHCVFSKFRTLYPKPPGVGVPPRSPGLRANSFLNWPAVRHDLFFHRSRVTGHGTLTFPPVAAVPRRMLRFGVP
jgi:hypothetical protein